MDSQYEIVRYRPDLKAQVLALQTHLWSPDRAINTSYFEWKYEQNPYLKEPLIFLAMHQGEAVGMRGFFGVRWEVGVPAQSFTGLYADDMVIAPAHRNHGLTSRIMYWAFEDLADRGYEYIFNLSAGPTTLLSSVAMGWRSAGGMQPMRWQSKQSVVRKRLGSLARKSPALSRYIASYRSRHSEQPLPTLANIGEQRRDHLNRDYDVSLYDAPRCNAMAQLVGRLDDGGHIRHVRDADYFRWRFANPLSRYIFLYADTAQLDGYLVLQEYTSSAASQGVVNIVDWEASDPAIKERLLTAAVEIAKSRQIVIWSATLPSSAIALLRKNGFKQEQISKAMVRSAPELLVRSLCRDYVMGGWMVAGTPLLDISSWDLRMLYSMLG
jgi:GNAT superfamily N-acetyltransferase